MDREISKHNERVARENTPPAEIPQPVADLAALVDEYNETERLQEERLQTLWSTLSDRTGAKRFVAFSSGERWTVNQFPTRTPGDRPDLHMGRALDGLISFITDFDLVE